MANINELKSEKAKRNIRITDLVEQLKGRYFGCPVCRVNKEIRISKNDRPYIICDNCGIQLFIRYEQGIKQLIQLINETW